MDRFEVIFIKTAAGRNRRVAVVDRHRPGKMLDWWDDNDWCVRAAHDEAVRANENPNITERWHWRRNPYA